MFADRSERLSNSLLKVWRFSGRGYVGRCGVLSDGGYRLIIDGVSGPILANAILALAPDGICVCYGVTDNQNSCRHRDHAHWAAQILGFHLYAKSESSPPSDNLPRLLSLVAAGRLNCAIEREASYQKSIVLQAIS